MKISIKSIYVLLGSLFITISLLFLFYVHELNSVSKELSLIGRDRNVMILKSQELRHSSDRVQVSIDEKNSAITNLFRKMYSLIIAGILLFLLVIYFTIKRILIPVKALTQSISLYDKGDINIEERIYYHDEIGLMTQQYFNLKNKLLDERNMFLEGPVVIFKWRNAEGWPIEYVSTNVEMILGYSREEFFKNTITYSDIIDKKYQGKVAEEVNDAVDKKIKHFDHAPYEIIRKTGEKIYISDHTSLLYDEQGNITHFLGYITDISKTIAIEHELIKSKETIERYLNIAAEIILTLDKNGTITLLNESGHKLLGYENGTLIGKNWFETSLPKAIVPDVKVIFNKLMMGDLENVENYENSLLTRDGKDIMVFWHNTLLRDDEDRIIGVLSSGENITLYKQAEIALKESEYKLLEAQKISQLGHWELDLTNNKLLWSDEIYRIFNLEPKQFDANYDEFLENIHPEDKDFVNKAYSDSLKTKRPYDIVHRLLMKNGSIKYVNEKCTTEFDENGKALRSMGTIQDITDYKSGEIALRESETKFRILADHTADWEYWVLPDNTYKYVSPSCKSISGYSNDEFIENPALFFDIIHPDFKNMMKDHFQFSNEHKAGHTGIEFMIKAKDGQLKWVEHYCKPIFDDKDIFLGLRGSNRDISLRKEYEGDLEKFNVLVAQSPFSIVLTDLEGNINYVNPYFEKITGYSFSEAKGQHTRILNSGNTDPKVFTHLWETITKGHDWKGEFQNKKKNDELYWESASISPLKNHKGEIFQYMAIKEDITEKKLLENQLFQSQKMDAIGQFAGGIAHDFNNILTAIMGFTQIGLMDDKDDSILQNIQSSSERAASLVKKLLGFSRKQIIEPQVLDMKYLIDDLEKMLNRMIGEDILIVKKYKDDIPLIFADPGQIEQIIINLIVNARDAINMKEDVNIQKRITVNLKSDKIIRPRKEKNFKVPPGSYVVISVSDTGIGMDAEIQKKIFEPFYTTKEVGKGTGLGLATVYGIIKQNKGYITVYSELGKGTTFNIYWPVIETPKITSDKGSDLNTPLKGNETLVLIEDDIDIITMAENGLTKLGYTVISYSDPVLALKEIPKLEQPIDLLITDVIMPHLNGKELAEKLLTIKPDLTILYSSGYTDDHIVNAGILKKNVHFISKPYNLVELTHKIKEIISKK